MGTDVLEVGLKWHLFVYLKVQFSVFFFNSCLLIIIWPLSRFNRPKNRNAKLYSILETIMLLPESCERPYQDPCEIQRRLSVKKYLYVYMTYAVIRAHWANRKLAFSSFLCCRKFNPSDLRQCTGPRNTSIYFTEIFIKRNRKSILFYSLFVREFYLCKEILVCSHLGLTIYTPGILD